MRILMVTTYFHPIVGGMERQALALAKALNHAGHTVTVATCRFPQLGPREVIDGIQVHRVIRPRARGVLYAASYLSSLSAFLVRWRRHYDLIHVHLLYLDAVAAGLLRARLGKPVLVKAACGGAFGDVARLSRVPGRWLFRAGLRHVDRIVAISRQIREELVGYGLPSARIMHIPNGVDAERFRPSSAREPLRQRLGLRGNVAIFAGRLDPQKSLPVLIDAWTIVASRLSDATLLPVGGGDQTEELKRLVQQRNLSARVLFCAEQPDVLPYLQAADLFVLPSLAEGMSNALLEAMACGLPCVATRIGGNLELIRDGDNGRLVEPNDPSRLAEALLEMLGDGEGSHRMGLAARQTVEERYAMPRITEQYLHLYRELLNGTAGATR